MTSTITRALVATAAAASLCVAPAVAAPAHAALPAVGQVVARAGSAGATVRTIQNDLRYLGYFTGHVTGTYGPVTTAAVKSFQRAYKLTVTGTVDSTTFRMLRTKSDAQRAADKAAAARRAAALNKVVAKPGDKGTTVRQIQGRLSGLGYLPSSSVIGVYGRQTTAAVKSFQRAHGLAVTGVVTVRTNNALAYAYSHRSRTSTPAVRLPAACLVGRTICVNKSSLRMYWVINGKVQDSWSVRVGRPSLPTREGLFHIYLKSPLWHSTLYNVDMPWTQFFSGGEAVHYSRDFAVNGYYGGGSHGCVNMRDYSGARWLYNQTRVGDRVYVYR